MFGIAISLSCMVRRWNDRKSTKQPLPVNGTTGGTAWKLISKCKFLRQQGVPRVVCLAHQKDRYATAAGRWQLWNGRYPSGPGYHTRRYGSTTTDSLDLSRVKLPQETTNVVCDCISEGNIPAPSLLIRLKQFLSFSWAPLSSTRLNYLPPHSSRL